VAPEAATRGRDRPRDGEDLADLARLRIHGDLHAHLMAGNQILMHQGVPDEARLIGVGSEEEVVALGEPLVLASRDPATRGRFAMSRRADLRV
jgi:hypothetical protein